MVFDNSVCDADPRRPRESPENSLGMIRVFCPTPLRCGFGFESWSRGGDDESSHGRGDCVVQGCRPEVDRTQAQGVPGPGDLGLLGREHLESGASVRVVSPYRDAGVERTANWDHLPGKYFRLGNHKTETKFPELEADIRTFADPESQADPKFQSPFLYTRITAKGMRQALIDQKG